MGGDEALGSSTDSAASIQPFLSNEELMHCYRLESRQFVYDEDSNHLRQCWQSIYEFEICLEPEEYHEGENDMILDVIPPSNGNVTVAAALADSFSFLDDKQWDEVNLIEDN